MTQRPGVVRAIAVATVAALAPSWSLWRTLDAKPLAVGIGVGALGAIVAAGISALRRLPWWARAAVVATTGWAVIAVAAASPTGPLAVPERLSLLLSVTWPAAGLAGLAALPACLAFISGGVAGWRASRSDPTGAALAIGGGFVAGAFVAAPVGVPWWAPVMVMVAIGAVLAACRDQRTDVLPVLGATPARIPSTAVTTRHRWASAVAAIAPATALGAASIATPTPGTLDLRQWVDAPTITVADDNPLAIVARAVDDPPARARAPDVEVVVDGPAPGRLRLAVLEAYGPAGWHQAAAFGPTGRTLPPNRVTPTDLGERTSIVVRQLPGSTGLRATPTAGSPMRVAQPGGVHASPGADVLLATGDGDVAFETIPAETAPTVVAQANVPNLDPALSACPSSPLIAGIASGIVGDALDPVSRLRAIESYLKFRRVYDPGAPGGQTLAGIERFLAQDFARGNLESFVTSFAVLARCAGVPVRVVVGYPAPAADATTSYAGTDLTAWVETPLTASGWVPFDPVPTPEEQERQARAAQEPPPAAVAPPDVVEPAQRTVAPRAPGGGTPWRAAVAAVLVLVAALVLWTFGLPALVEARRRRIDAPAPATLAAWASVTDRLVDRKVPVRAHMTPTECTRAAPCLPDRADAALRALAELADQARYDAASLSGAEAAAAWTHAREASAALPRPWLARLLPLRSPRRAWRRLAATAGDRSPG